MLVTLLGRSDSDTLNFLIETMPTNLDPRVGTDAYSQHMHDLIFSSLVGRDAQMNFTPDLATSWEYAGSADLHFSFASRRAVSQWRAADFGGREVHV